MTSPNGRPGGSDSPNDVWTDTDDVVNGSSYLTAQETPTGAASPGKVRSGAVFDRNTGTLVGVDDDALSSRSIRLTDYQLQVQVQRNQHRMQGWVLTGILFVILTTIVFPVVSVGVHWISEDFAQQIISLVLTAALSGLGGAVAYAFRGASSSSGSEPQATNQR